MQITNQQPQRINMAGTGQVFARFNDKQHLRYQTLAEKVGARLYNSKAGSDLEMIERFYYRLFPVTYREWLHK